MAILNSIKNLPAIPRIMFEVQQLVRDSNTDTYKLASVIGQDQGLTAKIIAIANSPLFGMQRKVSSLEFAIMVLGFEEINKVVTALTLANAVQIKSSEHFNYEEFWMHSIIVGTAAKEIARNLGHIDIAADAFVAGMLHDLGIQVLYKYFHTEFLKIVEHGKEIDENYYQAELDVLGVTHQEIGTFLVAKWGLPRELCESIFYHHRPSQAKQFKKMASIIHLTDYMTQQLQVAPFYWDTNMELDMEIIDILEFGDRKALADFIIQYKESFTDTVDAVQI
jgi:HD-like signal output (HDOD) protein